MITTNDDVVLKIVNAITALKKDNQSKIKVSVAIDDILFNNGGYTVKMNMGDFLWVRRNGQKVIMKRNGDIVIDNGFVTVTIQ
jgi:hypothetical protein